MLVLAAACARDPAATRSTTSPPDASEIVGPVTDDMLRGGHAERPFTWPVYGGDWAQTRFSPLDQIRPANVAQLRPAWVAQTGVIGSFENTPIVLGREMYVTTPAEQGVQKLLRLDAVTGEVVWQVTIQADAAGKTAATEDLHLPSTFGPSRGVAAYGERVYLGTLNGTILALDRRTGARVFEVRTLAPRLTGAPLAARGVVVQGLSWLERGAVQGFDAESGKLLWTWYTIPSPDEGGWWGTWQERLPGRDDISLDRDITQEKANQQRLAGTWKVGGAAAPMTPTYDPERGLIYVSIGGPDPHGFPPGTEPHPGDMRWSNSVCALRLTTGEEVWCYQFLPHDIWGASGPSPPILFGFQREGQSLPAVGRFTGLGNFYTWTRNDGRLLKVSDNYVPVDGTKGGIAGTVWSPGAYDPNRRVAYAMSQIIPGYFERRDEKRTQTQGGNIAAVSPESGQVLWQQRFNEPLSGGVLVTSGGLVFAGRSSGWFDAYSAETGAKLWSFRTGAGCNSAPITYRLGGQQFVAVSCGGHGVLDPQGGDAVFAFSLAP